MAKEYTRAEVKQHKSVKDGGVWIIIGSSVYDVTKFLEEVSGSEFSAVSLSIEEGDNIMIYK